MELILQDRAWVTVRVPGDPDKAFATICRNNPNARVERWSNGTITIMPPAGNESSYRNVELIAQLRNWAKKDGRGRVFDSNTVFGLQDTSLLGPDAAWISNQKIASFSQEEREKFLPVAPEFLIELKSRTDRPAKLRRKMQAWIDNGVELAWLIDAKKQIVSIYSPGKAIRELSSPARVLGEGPVAGFELDMDDIYRGLSD